MGNKDDSETYQTNCEFHQEKLNSLNKMNKTLERNITVKELIPSFWLSQVLLLTLGILFLWLIFLRNSYSLTYFFSMLNLMGIGFGGTLVAILGIGLQWGAWKIFPLSAFEDGGINHLLLTLPTSMLILMFAFGAFTEELLVRGVLLTWVALFFGPPKGVLLTSLIFTVMHFRYLKKPVLIGGVFTLSIFLGSLYSLTGTLWASVWAHFIYNLGTAWLAKRYYLPFVHQE